MQDNVQEEHEYNELSAYFQMLMKLFWAEYVTYILHYLIQSGCFIILIISLQGCEQITCIMDFIWLFHPKLHIFKGFSSPSSYITGSIKSHISVCEVASQSAIKHEVGQFRKTYHHK